VRSRVMSFSFSLSLRALPAYSSILRPNARQHDSLRRLWQLTNSGLWWLMFIRVAV
jgi:ligand-binding sensor domain-containing protein